ncbi:MAG: hypothetical protein EXS42_00335 [Lacunisphaera sp.]|nr:hypothetical protein [Lacunisphaera sp.]
MDVFLLHCLLLIWTSIGAARQLTGQTADRLLAAALLAWGNIVATSLLLASLHRLGDPAWFFGTSGLLAGLTCLLMLKVRPESSPVTETPAAKPNPWLAGAFILTLAPLALVCLGIVYTYQPNDEDSFTYHLPRAMYYLGQNSLAHFDASDLRQIYPPFNYNLLQAFALIYSPPLQCLNLFNPLAWAVSGIAIFRLCRLCGLGPNASLVATWLAITSTPVLAQATGTSNDLPAGAALLCALVFALAWRQTRRTRDALLAGLATGLAVGSNLTILYFIPVSAHPLQGAHLRLHQHPALEPRLAAATHGALRRP